MRPPGPLFLALVCLVAVPVVALAALAAFPGIPLEAHAARTDGAPALPVADGPGDQRAPAIVFGGNQYLAIWETCDDCPVTGADLAVRALDRGGAPIGPITVIEDSPLDARSPALAYNADKGEYLAVWSVRYPGVADRYGVRIRRLGLDGRPVSTTVQVAEVVGVWPAAVVSSSGAWHGFDVAWAAPGPQPLLATTVIHTRHVDADGVPAAEVWQLSDPGYEALRPRSLRTSGGAGALVAWFAYRPGQNDEPRLRGVRLGLSGRPIGTAAELVGAPVCEAALSDHVSRPELLLTTIGCDGRLPEASGGLTLARLNRSGATIGEPVLVTDTVVARDLAVSASSLGDYMLVRPAPGAMDPISQTLTAQRFDADLLDAGPVDSLGVGEGPALAGDDRGGAIVLAARLGSDWDVVSYGIAPPVAPTPSATPDPSSRTATPTGTREPETTATPTVAGGHTPTSTGGPQTAVPTVPTGTAGTARRIALPLALRGQ